MDNSINVKDIESISLGVKKDVFEFIENLKGQDKNDVEIQKSIAKMVCTEMSIQLVNLLTKKMNDGH